MDIRVMHGKLMNEHRMISNEISDIKVSNYELTKEQKERVDYLENQLTMIAGRMYNLYKQ
jgi:hypothetical protein